MVRGLKRQISTLYGVYVTNLKALIGCAVHVQRLSCNMQVFSVLKQCYKCILQAIGV